MKILIDARWIFEEISGVGEYTRQLISHLARLPDTHDYVLLFNKAELRDRTLTQTGVGNDLRFSTVLYPHSIFSPLGQVRFRSLLRRLKPDLYHSTNYMIALGAFPKGRRGTIPCVTTIHDVIPLLFPDHAPKSKKARWFRLYRWIMCQIGARADVIVTDSQSSANDIARMLKIPAASCSKIRVVACGVSDRFQPPVQRRPGATQQVLYVGRMDPYKNVTGLIRAFAQAMPSLPGPARLTLAGAPDERYPEAANLARELGVADAVTWTGYLSDADLVELYQQADLLAHPSHYEGFGLQVLEAMACGLPVLCSNAASLPEVAGDAAWLLDPNDTNAWAAALTELLANPERRAELTRAGLERVKTFIWERTARETLAIYATAGAPEASP